MYHDIGGKIKGMAVFVAIIGIIASFSGGMVWASIGSRDITKFVTSVLIAAVGCLVSWISSLLIYGFGEIIDKLTEIEHNTQVKSARDTDGPDDIKSDADKYEVIERLRKEGGLTDEEYQRQQAFDRLFGNNS